MGIKPGESDAQDKEKESRPNGGADQNLRCLRTPYRLGKAAAKSCSKTFLLAALHHDDEAHEGAIDHKEKQQNINEDIGPERIHLNKGQGR